MSENKDLSGSCYSCIHYAVCWLHAYLDINQVFKFIDIEKIGNICKKWRKEHD